MWRFEAIRQVLRDQHECFQQNAPSAAFHSDANGAEPDRRGKIRNYLPSSSLHGDAKAFFKQCSAIKAIPQDRSQALIGSHSWALKTLLHNMLCSYFGNPNLSALFFPQVLYQGTKVRDENRRLIDSPMLHWLVLCRFGDESAPTPEFWPSEYLSKPSVKVQMAHGQGNAGLGCPDGRRGADKWDAEMR